MRVTSVRGLREERVVVFTSVSNFSYLLGEFREIFAQFCALFEPGHLVLILSRFGDSKLDVFIHTCGFLGRSSRITEIPASQDSMSTRSKLRSTVNSISSLEEQNIFLRIMADKGVANSGEPAKVTGGDKKKKRKAAVAAKGGTGDDRPAPGASGSGNNVAKPTAARPAEDQDGSDSGEFVSIQPWPQPVQGGSGTCAPGQPGTFQQWPYFYQQFPPMLQPNLGYPGFGHPLQMPAFAGGGDEEEDTWEMESQSSGVSAQVERRVHDISDDEEEGPGAGINQIELPKDLDFSSFKSGKMADCLKSSHLKATEADQLGPEINSTMAKIVDEFFLETRVLSEMERITKEYPKVRNMDNLVVPKLNPELFGGVDQSARAADIGLQNAQKALVAVVSAVAPLGAMMLSRGSDDEQLDQLSPGVVNSLRLLALTIKYLSGRRREQLKPSMKATYAKALSKPPEGKSEWLYGDLSESAKRCELAQKVSEKLIKRKGPSQGTGQNQQQKGNFKGNGQGKRFKQGGAKQFQQQQFATQGYQAVPYGYQNYQQFQQAPFQYQAYRPKNQNHQAGQQQQQQQGDFQKKGPRK